MSFLFHMLVVSLFIQLSIAKKPWSGRTIKVMLGKMTVNAQARPIIQTALVFLIDMWGTTLSIAGITSDADSNSYNVRCNSGDAECSASCCMYVSMTWMTWQLGRVHHLICSQSDQSQTFHCNTYRLYNKQTRKRVYWDKGNTRTCGFADPLKSFLVCLATLAIFNTLK